MAQGTGKSAGPKCKQPYEMESHPVSSAVNRPEKESAELIVYSERFVGDGKKVAVGISENLKPRRAGVQCLCQFPSPDS